MKRSMWSMSLSLMSLASRAYGNAASAPWSGKAEEFTTGVLFGYAPYALALVLLGIVVAWWRYGDQEGWMGSLLKFGAGASVIGGAPAMIAFFMGATPAAPATVDMLQETIDLVGDVF
jgi:hypothetical protein